MDFCADWDVVICAGAAGALVEALAVGDVVATETVEHDIHNRFGPPLLPRFPGAAILVESFRSAMPLRNTLNVHFGAIASGDEDVVSVQRLEELRRRTGALAVAWEGAGGARACQFSEVPFIEIRAVTDGANSDAAAAYAANLESAMRNLTSLIIAWPRAETERSG